MRKNLEINIFFEKKANELMILKLDILNLLIIHFIDNINALIIIFKVNRYDSE